MCATVLGKTRSHSICYFRCAHMKRLNGHFLSLWAEGEESPFYALEHSFPSYQPGLDLADAIAFSISSARLEPIIIFRPSCRVSSTP